MSGYINEFVLVYLDDILVYSNNADEHEMHLRKVCSFAVAQVAGQIEKVQIWQTLREISWACYWLR